MQAPELIVAVKKDVRYNGQPVELFYYSPKKAEALKEVQSVSKLPELKPSDTRWLSHERCVLTTCKELSSLTVTLE